MIQEAADYARYLAGKKAIDDHSLNPLVWTAMGNWLKGRQHEFTPVRVLEAGAGIATMIERLLDAGLLHQCIYTAIEMEPGFMQIACTRLQAWSQSHAFNFTRINDHTWLLENGVDKIEIHWTTADVVKIKDGYEPGAFDLMIGHAVIDLLPVPLCLPGLLNCLDSKGAFYFSLNYAGVTAFNPANLADSNILYAYHNDMDRRFSTIDWQASLTGLRLGQWLEQQNHKIVAEGPSDWQLQAGMDQTAITNQFIADILATIDHALMDLPGLSEWHNLRREQLQTGQLQLHAANRDYFGLVGKPYIGTRC